MSKFIFKKMSKLSAFSSLIENVTNKYFIDDHFIINKIIYITYFRQDIDRVNLYQKYNSVKCHKNNSVKCILRFRNDNFGKN